MATADPNVSTLTLNIDQHDDTTVVKCKGKLVAGVCDVLYKEVSRAIPKSKNIVLDLSELGFMDSMGLGTIVRLYVSAKTAGCGLELIHIGKRVREMLGITHVLSLFEVCGEHNLRIP